MSLRLKLVAPLALATAALAVYLPGERAVIGAWGVLSIIATLAAIELWVRRPLAQAVDFTAALARGGTAVEPPQASGGFGALARALGEARETIGRAQARASFEVSERRKAEQAARENEERYVLAVSGANDGLWEWNLRADTAYFSPRWKTLLGFDEGSIGGSIDEWRDRIHADDRTRALAELTAHLDGRTPRYECELRVKHRDGRYRWHLVRGAAIHDSLGQPTRLVGLNTDITARKRAEEILRGLAAGLDSVRDDAFFQVLVKNFATVLGVRRAFITECADEARRRVRKIAQWDAGQYTPLAEYDLEGTPCETVIREGRSCVYSSRLAELFPHAKGFESYIGIPMFDGERAVIGHLVAVDPSPHQEEFPIDLIYSLFAVRASLEFERRYLLARLPPTGGPLSRADRSTPRAA